MNKMDVLYKYAQAIETRQAMLLKEMKTFAKIVNKMGDSFHKVRYECDEMEKLARLIISDVGADEECNASNEV